MSNHDPYSDHQSPTHCAPRARQQLHFGVRDCLVVRQLYDLINLYAAIPQKTQKAASSPEVRP